MKNIDEISKKIIELLQEDGTMTNASLGRVLGISEASVRRRRLKLQEADVIRIAAVADPFKLGFEIMAIIGIQIERNRLHHVEEELVAMPEVRFLGVTLGTYDIMLEAWFGSRDEFLKFVTEDLAKIDGIQRTESFQIMRLSKYTYDWGQPAALRQEPGSNQP